MRSSVVEHLPSVWQVLDSVLITKERNNGVMLML